MMEKDQLLPKANSPYGSTNDRTTEENCQRCDYEYPSTSLNGYEPIPTGTEDEIFFNQRREISENQVQGIVRRIPSDYAGYSWLSLLCCCFPLALVAIYKSDQVVKSIRRGDFIKAREHSVVAKKLSSLAIIYGLLIIIASLSLYYIISIQVTKTSY